MKIKCNVEILRDFTNSNVYVYKLDQTQFYKKNIDIRDIVDNLLKNLHVYNQ